MMKQLTVGAISALITSAVMVLGEPGNLDMMFPDRARQVASVAPSGKFIGISGIRQRSNLIVTEAVMREPALGATWVEPILKIVDVESKGNCRALGPRLREGDQAIGLGQLRLASARRLGYKGDVEGLRDCETNAKWTVAYVLDCLKRGSKTQEDISWCHVSGNAKRGTGTRMGHKAFSYATSYVAMVNKARIQVASNISVSVFGAIGTREWGQM